MQVNLSNLHDMIFYIKNACVPLVGSDGPSQGLLLFCDSPEVGRKPAWRHHSQRRCANSEVPEADTLLMFFVLGF